MNSLTRKALVLAALALWLDSSAHALTDEEIAESDRLLQAGEFHSAEALYREAFARDPSDAQAALRLIYSLIVQAKPEEAASFMDHMIERDYQYLGEFIGQWGKHSHDPVMVMNAALGISDERQRALAVMSAAGGWATEDAESARTWVLTLPPGQVRDEALTALARVQANEGETPSPAVLSAFSSDLARQERLVFVIAALARRNAPEARKLMDTYMTDPDLRERAERMFARAITLPKP